MCGVLGGCGGGGSSEPAEDAGPGGEGTAPPDAGPPTSDDLIDDAVAAGTISAETGLIYHVFAAFGDTRLPAEYRGTSARNGSMAMKAAVSGWDSLMPETQAILEPFTIPPSAAGSWAELPTAADPQGRAGGRAIEWSKYRAQGGAVTVWSQNRYEGEDALAQAIAAEIDARIWKKLTGAGADEAGMKAPPSDGALMNNGGDASLDIYLVHLGSDGDYGTTSPYDDQTNDNCGPWAAYVNINTQVAVGDKLFPTVAHELMHALQQGYTLMGDCGPEAWWDEATATWVEDFVYPGRNSEQEYTYELLGHTELSLESTNADHEYGAYLFPFVVYRKYNKPRFVSRSYELAAGGSLLDAIQSALTQVDPKGWKGVFPEFTLRNWNQRPVTDYKDWDRVPHAPPFDDRFEIRADTDRHPLGTVVEHLAARYVELTVGDPRVKRVTLDNSLFGENVTGGHVWLIPKIDGELKEPEVLGQEKRFCRDRPDENVESMTLVISNWDWHAGYSLADELILVSGSAAGCQEFSGTVDLHIVSENKAGTADITYHAEPTFAPDEELGDGYFTMTANSWTYHAVWQLTLDPPCRTEHNASGLFAPPVDSGQIVIFGATPPQYHWQVALGGDATVTQVTNCNDQREDETTMFPMAPTIMGINTPRELETDGSATGTEVQGEGTLTWSFRP